MTAMTTSTTSISAPPSSASLALRSSSTTTTAISTPTAVPSRTTGAAYARRLSVCPAIWTAAAVRTTLPAT